MSMVRFSIEEVFDLRQRAGLLASGKFLEGEVLKEMTLQDEKTGRTVKVLALEFQTPRDRREGWTTLLLERTDPSPVVEHAILIATSSGT